MIEIFQNTPKKKRAGKNVAKEDKTAKRSNLQQHQINKYEGKKKLNERRGATSSFNGGEGEKQDRGKLQEKDIGKIVEEERVKTLSLTTGNTRITGSKR